MSIKSITSPFVHTWQGLGFWSGFSLRNRLIATLKPAKESQVTNIIMGLCVIVSALVPFTAAYELVRTAPAFREQEAAISFSTAVAFIAVISFAFIRRVFVWPGLSLPAHETAQRFEEASFAMLATSGSTRWKLIGLSVAQAAITVSAIVYVKQNLIGGALVIYLAVWLPALIALAGAVALTRTYHAGGDSFSDGDKALMGLQVSMNLTVVASIVATILVYAATIILGLAIFIVAGLILWRAFAGRTDPANTDGLFESAKAPTDTQWRDTSGATHVAGDGSVRQAHTGVLLGNVDATGRVIDSDGSYKGSVGGDGQLR